MRTSPVFGPPPTDGQQAVVLLVTTIFLGLGALLAASVGLRWRAA